ncbi:MAG: hypothetical protein LBK52_00825 [Deltaproteobacteria bacterium]|jgi:hypothetical protein|nr:hypothetical protein [Deltaproteobacteria bacterium]
MTAGTAAAAARELAAAWKNGNWGRYVRLYYQDPDTAREAAGPGYLPYALYNELTRVLIEEPDAGEILFLASGLEAAAAGPEAALLSRCARIALGLVRRPDPARFPGPAEIEALPEPYRTLGLGLLERRPKSARSGGLTAAALKQLKDQFQNLTDGGSLESLRNLAKTLNSLKDQARKEGLRTGLEVLDSAVSIVKLAVWIRKTAGQGSSLSRLQLTAEKDYFLSLAPQKTNPGLICLWNLLGTLGESCYGPDWGQAARLMILKFQPELAPAAARLYQSLLNLKNPLPQKPDSKKSADPRQKVLEEIFGRDDPETDAKEELQLKVLELMLAEDLWNDHELYILSGLYFRAVMENLGPYRPAGSGPAILKAAAGLTAAGRRWRTGFKVWPDHLPILFSQLICSGRTGTSLKKLAKIDLPGPEMDPTLNLALIFGCPAKADLFLASPEMAASLEKFLPVRLLPLLLSTSGPAGAGWEALARVMPEPAVRVMYTAWLRNIVRTAALFNAEQGFLAAKARFLGPNSQPRPAGTIPDAWPALDRTAVQFGLEHGPVRGWTKNLLRLLVFSAGGPPRELADKKALLTSLHKNLEKDSRLAANLLLAVLDWKVPDQASDFLTSLAFRFHFEDWSEYDDEDDHDDFNKSDGYSTLDLIMMALQNLPPPLRAQWRRRFTEALPKDDAGRNSPESRKDLDWLTNDRLLEDDTIGLEFADDLLSFSRKLIW